MATALSYSLDERTWGGARRGFWTQRKKTGAGLLSVMAMLAGIAVAFKVFDQVVPNNTVRDASNFSFLIEAQDVAAGETAFRPATGVTTNDSIFREMLVTCPPVGDCTVDVFPGDERRSDVRITNTNDPPAKDASFQVYVDPFTVVVTDSAGVVVPPSDARRARFINFWTLRVEKQTYFGDLPVCSSGGDCSENNANSSSSYAEACESGLLALTRTAPCKLGIVRASGSVAGPVNTQPTDDRIYRFFMAEADSGDQTQFIDWRIQFNLVFQAKVPPDDEGDRYSLLPVL